MLSNLIGTPFLNEPAYRWAIFVVVMMLFLAAMGGILRHM